jgi:hypothetical protein
MTCFFKSEAFIPGMWTFRNPKNESVLLSDYERDELFKASLPTYEIEEEPVQETLVEDKKKEAKILSNGKKDKVSSPPKA